MSNQTVHVQTRADDRAVYIKPNLEHHPQYSKTVKIGCCSIPSDMISNPGLELIPDPVDLGI